MSQQFNEEQREAICFRDGPAIVLAGPGSGKTLVITHRVRWLIESAGVSPENILVITFTRAAAMEMKKRFFHFRGMAHAPVTFGTFHAVFFMMLRYACSYNTGDIIREEERRRLIREITRHMELELEDENDFISTILGEISYVKGEMISLDYYHSTVCSDQHFRSIYQSYEKELRREKKIDFDDMLVFCYRLLSTREDILALWRRRFRYILIDEFQDINRIQYEIVKMLAGEDRNLFVVGDDDQSIYRFRGARPEIMLGFEKDFPRAKRIILGVNYRCSKEITDIAGRLIANNRRRYQKQLTSARGPVVPVTVKEFENVSEECSDILEGIRFYKEKGIPLNEMAVIYRTNSQPRTLVSRLMESSIPFKMKDLLPNLFDHWIARNIITYIRVALGDRDRGAFLTIMNRPKRYISRQMVSRGQVDLRHLKRQAMGKRWLYEYIDRMEMDLALLKGMDPYTAVSYIRKGIGYDDYLAEYASYRKVDPAGLYETADEIQESAKNYHTYREWFDAIDAYGKELKEQRKKLKETDTEGITLTTMHSSKGLEYEVVFVMDVNEGITPHRKAVKEADLEEERRLFYVALTRARSYLFLYSVKHFYQKETAVSRYIREIRDPRDRREE